MLFALQTTTSAGPNDLLNGQDGKPYWVSTVRYPAGHWQTAVFDQSLPNALDRPLFLMNATTDPTDALINHLAALVLIAGSPRSEWPTGMHDQCSEPTWRNAVEFATAQLQATQGAVSAVHAVGTYVAMRERYQARHL